MNKPGYFYVDEHSISPSLICPICLEILQEPYTHLPCDSAFCGSCLAQLVEPLCPICRWTWDDSMPIQSNIYLSKSSRLIRNMLDDLRVQCVHCHTIRRRGAFEHQCQPNGQLFLRKSFARIPRENPPGNVRMLFSNWILFFLLLFIYTYRDEIFEQGINRQNELINEIGYDLDYYFLEQIYYSAKKFIAYSMTMLFMNMCFWLTTKFYGDRLTSKSNCRILGDFFQFVIIINLITHSFYNYNAEI